MQVGKALLAVRHGLHQREIPRFLVNGVQQAVGRERGREGTETVELFDDPGGAGFTRFGALAQRQIQRSFGQAQAHRAQLIRRKAADRAHQHRKQRDILHRVIHRAQKRQNRGNLRRLKKAAGGIRPGGHAAQLQLACVAGGILVCAAQQNAEVAEHRLSPHPIFRYLKALCHQLQNGFGNMAAFQQLHRFVRALAHGQIENVEPGFAAFLRRIRRAGREKLFAAVFHIPGLRGHQLPEHKIHRVGHGRAGTKILVEHNTGRVAAVLPVIFGEVGAPLQKDAGHRLAEAVNALFDVADHKQIFFVLRNRAEQ